MIVSSGSRAISVSPAGISLIVSGRKKRKNRPCSPLLGHVGSWHPSRWSTEYYTSSYVYSRRQRQHGGRGATTTCRSSLLPAGKRQVRVEIPGILLEVETEKIMKMMTESEEILDIEGSLSCVTGVIVKGSAGLGAGDLYSAVMALREKLSGRNVMLMVEDRSDVAEASGADGVMVSARGLPIVVAKGGLGSGTVVGKVATSGQDATKAAFEGAGLVIMDASGGSVEDLVCMVNDARQQTSGSSIPVMGRIGGHDRMTELFSDVDSASTREIISQMDGIVMEFEEFEEWNRVCMEQHGMPFGRVLVSYLSKPVVSESASSAGKKDDETIAQVTDVLSATREGLIATQKEFLTDLIDFLECSCPLLEEVSLLKDSLKQLDELFLVVIVGEFNSGKSAVVNAMLGGSVVPEGILPTTNEITVIKWADVENGEEERVEQDSDGLFVRYTAADLLKEINIVDTPGTNVILERQQRLTEEFIPRADLVLFVLSADRPFTDSEVKFLKYVRQWGKKVVFVINKVDLLANSSEVDEVVEFVENNAKRLLSVEGAKAIPVSAKRATEAKLECRYALGDTGKGVLTQGEKEYLSTSQKWKSSRFENLESHVRDFLLGGSTNGTSESLKLKLQTPLFVAEALMGAAMKQLEVELAVLRRDEESIKLVQVQMKSFRDEMDKEAKVQKAEIIQQTDRMVDMVAGVIDQVLQLSNWQALLPYLDKNASPAAASSVLVKQDISKDAMGRVNNIVEEHKEWLHVNCSRVEDNYRQFVLDRMAAYGEAMPSTSTTSVQQPERHSRQDVDMKKLGDVLESEVRAAVTSSINTAASAAGLGLVLTYILPNTLEDLLALAFSAAVGYTSLLNIPVRRIEAKKKIKSQISEIVETIHDEMDSQRNAQLQACQDSVEAMIAPLQAKVQQESLRLDTNMKKIETEYQTRLESLRKEIV